jgi:HPt (histidine-containing phosphotransfer) domain-containing protein
MNDVVIKPIRRDALLAAMASWLMARDADGPEPPVPQPTSAEPACAEEPTVDPPPNPIDQADGAAPIDLDEATREFGGDREMVEMVVGGFLDDAKGQVVSLREAVRNGDTETLRREAHKIKGGAANLTAYPLAAAARELEELAKTGRVAEAQTSLDQLEYRFDELWNLFRDPSNPT